jgi:hypothetical protein
LETVLAPIWVWLGTGEAPSPRMMAGGAVVVVTLTVYVLSARRKMVGMVPDDETDSRGRDDEIRR